MIGKKNYVGKIWNEMPEKKQSCDGGHKLNKKETKPSSCMSILIRPEMNQLNLVKSSLLEISVKTISIEPMQKL